MSSEAQQPLDSSVSASDVRRDSSVSPDQDGPDAPFESAHPTALIGQLRTSQIQVEELRVRSRQREAERAAGASAVTASNRRAAGPSLGETMFHGSQRTAPVRTFHRPSWIGVAGGVLLLLALAAGLFVILI